jgi:polysaccharide biosynthesis protein PslE
MIKANDQFLTFSDIFGALKTRFWSVILLTGFLSGLSAAALLMLRNTYNSEGEFYLNLGRGTVTIDTSATTSQVASLQDTRQSEVQSIKDMLQCRMMIERTVRRVGVDRILEQQSWFDVQRAKISEKVKHVLGTSDEERTGLTTEQLADLERVQGAVEYVADRLTVGGDKEGNTVQIKVKAHTSLLAHDITEALMTEFQEHYVKVHRTVGSKDFFDGEYAQTQIRVREAEGDLAAYKNKMKAISIESKRDLLHKESTVLHEDLIKTEADVIAKKAEITELETLIAAEPMMMKTQATARSSAASDSMRGDLYKLEVQESELASKYSDDHPLLIKTREALAESRNLFKKQNSMFDEQAEAINPVRQELTISRMKSVGLLEALEAREKAINESIAKNEAKIEQLNGDEIKVAELTRNVELIREELKNYSHKREEARRQTELDEALISALQISSPATLVIKKSGPPRMIGLAVLGTFAFLFAGGLAVYRESTNEVIEEDESFSPIGGYGRSIEQPGLHEVLNREAKPDAYTVLSTRLTRPESTETPKSSPSNISVHVTENIRG